MSRSHVEAVAAALAAHHPRDPREERSLRRARALLRWLPAPLDPHADPAHLTGSAIVRDADGRVLLHRHRRLGRWLQPGGHLEPDEHPATAAVRETREETGLAARHVDEPPRLLHVDVHEGPRSHVHLDLRYLLTADGSAALAPGPDESPDVAWLTLEEALGRADVSLRAALVAVRAAPAVTTPRGGPRRPR